jgi:hypothetical protein
LNAFGVCIGTQTSEYGILPQAFSTLYIRLYDAIEGLISNEEFLANVDLLALQGLLSTGEFNNILNRLGMDYNQIVEQRNISIKFGTGVPGVYNLVIRKQEG